MATIDTHPKLEVEAAKDLWAWLAAHGHTSDGAILITWKASDPARYVSREAVLDALVAYGWIDGRRFKMDGARTAQLITPRRVQHWAQSYKDRAERLEAEGRMAAPGRAAIADGKANGLWDFMADVDALIVPDDLAATLGCAQTQWDALPPSYRRNVLRWIKLAKTKATREKRITATAEATANGTRLPQM